MPECETCHGNHEIYAAKDELVGVTGDAVCAWCHSEDKLKRGYEVAKTMRQQIDSLVGSDNSTMALINEAEQKGMEVSEAKFKLREVRQAR
ncbi:MAG: cytochrome c3 family protein, partial [Bacteroidota bacterium]